MPELPEVETVRGQISPVLTGARIQQALIFDPRLVRPFAPKLVAVELEGEVDPHVIGQRQREQAIGNDANGERLKGSTVPIK